MIQHNTDAKAYADGLATQLRKGFLPYCVIKICGVQPRYASEVIKTLHAIDMVVVEGTIYPLLSRLQKDGILEYEWEESEQGPPRKYYKTSEYGFAVLAEIDQRMSALQYSISKIEEEV